MPLQIQVCAIYNSALTFAFYCKSDPPPGTGTYIWRVGQSYLANLQSPMTTSSSAPDKVKPILIDLVSPSPDKNCVKTGLGLRSCSKDRRIKDLNTIIANLKRSIATKTAKNEPKLVKSIQKLRDQVKTYEAKLYEIQSVEERSSSDSDLENLLKQSELAFKTVIETGLANVNRSLATTSNRESTSTQSIHLF